MKLILLLLFFTVFASADTPPPNTVKAKLYTGDGVTGITATGTSLNVNVTGGGSGTTTADQGNPNAGGVLAWYVQGMLGRTWTLSSLTDSVSSDLTQVNGVSVSLGAKIMAASFPVVIASDQSVIPISAASLPLPSGAATSALQTSGNASLTSIDSKSTAPISVLGPLTDAQLRATPVPISGTVAVSNFPATQAVTQSTSPWVVSGTVTANIGTSGALALDTSVLNTQGSPTGGTAATKSDLSGGIYNTSAPTLTNGQQAALQFDVNGNLKTTAAGGSASVTQGTSPWVDNISQFGGSNVVTGTGTSGAGIPRVTVSNDSNVFATQFGTWDINNVTGTVSLPTGAATSAKQPALGIAGTPSTDVITVQGITSMTALKVDGSAVTQPVSGTVTANQGGTWNINNVSGIISLPTGASTSANQSTANASLSSIDSKLGTLGQKAMAGSAPVVIASDQSAIPISGTITATNSANGNTGSAVPAQATQVGGTDGTNLRALSVDSTGKLNVNNISGTVSLPTGASTSANQTSGAQKTQTVDGAGAVFGPTTTISAVNYLPVIQASSGTPGAAVPARSTVVAGSDGTNAQTLSTDATGKLNINNISGTVSLPTGTATSANQTNASQKTQSVDGSGVVVANNYGTAANAQRVAAQIGNASAVADFNSGAVSAQTLRVSPATDVTQKVQNNLLSGTGTSSALNNTPIPATDVSNYQCLKFQVTGTSTQTLTMQGSGDDATWLTLNQVKDLNVLNTANQGTIVNTGGESVFYMPINTQFVRLISTAYTSGTMTVPYVFTSLPCSVDLGQRNVTVTGTVTTTISSGLLTSQAVSTDISSAARTTTFTSASINPQQGSMSESYGLNVTAVSGSTPTMDCTLFESNDTGANFQAVYQWERITATGQYWVPMRRVSGNRIQYQCVIAGSTPSFTFTLFRIDSQAAAPMLKRYFDRTIAPNSLNSTTAAFNVEGCLNISYGVAESAITTTAATFDLQLSEDGSSYESQGTTIAPAANSSLSIQALTVSSKFARLIVTSAGTGVTLNYAWIRCGGN